MVTLFTLSALLGVLVQSFMVDSQALPKPANRPVPNQQPRGGPNICGSGFRRQCCPGWMTDRNGLCTRAVCRTNCGFGICRSPNLCQCGRNAFGPTCSNFQGGGRAAGRCRVACRNGGRCSNFGCNCRRGFAGRRCEKPICGLRCLNNGRCISPNRCSCPYGFSGPRCELDYRVGECFTKVENMMCRNRLLGVKCTKVACCATVGKAWGVPCRLCPKNLPCQRGYIPNIKAKKCEDANECTMIPNICAGGTCVNTRGSYRCDCGKGRIYDGVKHRCSDIDECKKNPGICGFGGKCENLDGGFKCSGCGAGSELNKDKTACKASSKLMVAKCFAMKRNGACFNPFREEISVKKCCCQKIGRAYGDSCTMCPETLTSAYVDLCITGIQPTQPTYVTEKDGTRVTDKNGKPVTVKPGFEVVTDKDGEVVTDENGQVVTKPKTVYVTDKDGNRVTDKDGNEITLKPGVVAVTDAGGNVVTDSDGNVVTKPDKNVVTDKDGNVVTDSSGRVVTKPARSNDGVCYLKKELGRCSRGGQKKIAKVVCCCFVGGAAHGDFCESCPVKGSVAFVRLCMPEVGQIGVDAGQLALDECAVQGASICENGQCTDLKEGYMCTCDAGYQRKDKNTCIDKDECSTFTGICGNGRCRNTKGSYSCDCQKGYKTIPGSQPRCEDVDECDLTGTCANGKCRNLAGSYSCTCNTGFKEANGGCEDIDECKIKNVMCNGGMCTNTPGSYMCTCPSGYELAADQRTCIDKNECTESDTCQNGVCRNLKGSFQCTCNDGYVETKDKKGCIDVDECQNPDICMHGKCINGPGSYRCACDFGFTPSIDGKACLDTVKGSCFGKFDGRMCAMPLMKQLTRTECCCGMEPMGQRGWGSPCQGCPLEGSEAYKKMCPCKGMVSCKEDVDECKNNAGMILGVCNHGRCVNTMGDYHCACNGGYRTSKDRKDCVDINECKETPEVCMNGKCKNTNGTFECECQKGYIYSRASGKCLDVDECKDSNPCKNADCVNTAGSFKCKCRTKGETLDSTGLKCEDVRLGKCWTKRTNGVCENNVNGDVTKAQCCNTFGVAWGSPCESCPGGSGGGKDGDGGNLGPDGCKRGFAKKADACQDVNECKLYDRVCNNGLCKNTVGSFKCVCPTGYTIDDSKRNCLDTRLGICYESFDKESCKERFPGNQTKSDCCCSVLGKAWGTPCEVCPFKNSPLYNELCSAGNLDVDECRQFGMCKNGKCVNTKGSFKCICDRGFDVDEKGKACQDINECKIAKGICGAGKCINTVGSFRCSCDPGYRNAAMMEMCMDINECTESNPMPCMGGRCVNTPGSYRCDCPAGMEVMGAGIDCEDIDECTRVPGICKYGRCQNFIGGYLCACSEGFRSRADMKACLDIDECQINNGGCEYICNNTVGSYECKCQEGYQLTSNKRNCEDINECTRTPNICGEGNECKNVLGRHICMCNTGYEATRDGRGCIDVDECRSKKACQNGKCLNTAGSFKCECRPGFKLNKQAMTCIDIDECKIGNKGGCHKDARCVNTVGSFQCQCKPGYEGNGKTCKDLDECKLGLSTCSIDAKCTNTIGSFTCQCKAGFSGDGRTCIDINECVEDKTLCKYGQCANTIGGYECSCDDVGFQRSADKKSCLDVDECVALKGIICNHGQCINLIGGFKCDCAVGFQLDNTGNNCTDINECAATNMCTNGKCKNMMGMFKCICNPGYVPNKDMNACIDNRREPCYRVAPNASACTNSVASAVMKSDCCCSRFGKAWGNTCEICPALGTTEHKDLCPGGTGTATNGTMITDIDECKKFDNYCKNGKCENTVGGSRCVCPKGFFLNRMENCEDIDECKTSFICGPRGKCVNTKGSYRCECPPGVTYKLPQKYCVDERKLFCYHSDGNTATVNNSLVPLPLKEICTEKFPMNFTFAQCCCNMGTHFGDPCVECPTKGTDKYSALCVGKPDIIRPTSFPPDGIITTRSPIVTGPDGKPLTYPDGSPVTIHPGGVVVIGPDGKPITTPDGGVVTVRPGVIPITDEGGNPVTNPDGSIATAIPPNVITGPDSKPITGRDGLPLTKAPGLIPGGGDGTGGTTGVKTNPDGSIVPTLPPGPIGGGGGINPKNDINECEMLSNPCKKGECTNTVGGYKCKCDMGYKSTASIKMPECIDIDECMDSPCVNGTCKNFEGGFMCECAKGFNVDNTGRICKDINECSDPKVCQNGKCTNKPGNFKCECNRGYVLTMDMKTCEDADECAIPGICGAGKCKNLMGSYECICDAGFRRDTYGRCDDIDECLETPGACKNGVCKNTRGSFECVCDKGFVPTGTKKACRDQDECLEVKGFCDKGTCTNTIGSAICKCNEGYERTKDTCVDINECTQDPTLCEIGGTCINTEGSFKCICNTAGFRLGNQGRSCVDVREGVCFAKVEDNRCVKATAYQVTKSTCCCSMNAGWGDPCDLCPKEGTKEFSLYCPNGIGYNRNQTDINECELNYGECKNGKCVNTDGSYRCDCNKGYKKSGDPNVCVDVDECAELKDVCVKGNCTNSVGSYSCKCEAGYRPGTDSPTCVDVNECAEENDLCAHKCANVPGSYKCLCPRGFEVDADGRMCKDIDECKTSKNTCPQLCKNILGGFICLCGEGYNRIGGKCVDKNECIENPRLCKPFGSCQNFEGGYRCQCRSPYMRSKNGKMCQDMRRGLCFGKIVAGVCQAATKKMMKVSEGECCCMGGTAWGPTCSQCPKPGSLAYTTLCSKDDQTVNECDMIAGVCENGKCMDTEDTYMCMCNPGFKLSMNGKRCTDIDECKSNPCELGCTNLKGSYTCRCRGGFAFDQKTKKCADIDECKTNRHNCDHKCVNTVGSFRCACPDGYHKMGASCVDTDECLYNQYICGYGHQCVNTPGAYTCRCLMGYIYDKDKKQCVDIDECYGNTQCQFGCENTDGSYRCNCPKGYTRHYFYNQCVDVNECNNNACGSGHCTNTLGDYSCSCGSGYNYQGGSCGDTNECSNSQNPCQFGCKNTDGGFECGCPYGLVPKQGHCIVATGTTCTTCDSDAPDEVPLAKDEPEKATSATPDTVGSDSLPLAKDEGATDGGFYQSGVYGQQGGAQGGYQGGYGQTGAGYNQQTYQGGYYGGSGGYQQAQYAGGSLGYSGYTGGYSGGYSQSGFGVRSLRRSRGARRSKSMVISVGKDLKTTIPLLKFLPAIKGLDYKVEYYITAGNVTLFEVSQKGRLGYLHSTQPLQEGSYALKIGSRIKNPEIVDKEAKMWYNKKRFNLKLIVKVF